jgi:hypothetical protein
MRINRFSEIKPTSVISPCGAIVVDRSPHPAVSSSAHAAIDAFVGVYHEHVLAIVEAVDRTNLDAIHVPAFDAIFGDDLISMTPVAREGPADKTRRASGSQRYAQPLREIVR